MKNRLISWLVYGVYPLWLKRRSSKQDTLLQRKKAILYYAAQLHRRTMCPPAPQQDVSTMSPGGSLMKHCSRLLSGRQRLSQLVSQCQRLLPARFQEKIQQRTTNRKIAR